MAAQAIPHDLEPELLPVIQALGQLHDLVALVGGRSGEVLWTSDRLRALWGGRVGAGPWLGRLAASEEGRGPTAEEILREGTKLGMQSRV